MLCPLHNEEEAISYNEPCGCLLLSIFIIPVNAVQLEDRLHTHSHLEVEYKSPHSQFAARIPLTAIKCSEGFEIIMKKTNGMPACVKHSTATILLERRWGIHVLPDYQNGDVNSDLLKESKGSFSVKAQDVNYFENYTGYLAIPDTEGRQSFPAIILIHEFWGLNENMKETAEDLASHGYVALAVDLYGVKEAASTSDEARQLMSAYDQEQGIKNMKGAVEYLKTNYGAQKVGAIGWCFGGGQSLVLALNEQMDATVIYYGRVISDKDQLSSINWPVLGIFAGLDTGITMESVNEFDKALDELGIPNEIHIYPDVNHAFANPSGARYAPEETKDA